MTEKEITNLMKANPELTKEKAIELLNHIKSLVEIRNLKKLSIH